MPLHRSNQVSTISALRLVTNGYSVLLLWPGLLNSHREKCWNYSCCFDVRWTEKCLSVSPTAHPSILWGLWLWGSHGVLERLRAWGWPRGTFSRTMICCHHWSNLILLITMAGAIITWKALGLSLSEKMAELNRLRWSLVILHRCRLWPSWFSISKVSRILISHGLLLYLLNALVLLFCPSMSFPFFLLLGFFNHFSSSIFSPCAINCTLHRPFCIFSMCGMCRWDKKPVTCRESCRSLIQTRVSIRHHCRRLSAMIDLLTRPTTSTWPRLIWQKEMAVLRLARRRLLLSTIVENQ